MRISDWSSDVCSSDLAGEADLSLRYGDGRWQGVEAEAILRFLVSPVCAPSLQQAIAGRPSAEALAAQTFIREDYDDWDLWLKEAGLAGFKPSRELRFVDYSMAVTAAVSGHGRSEEHTSELQSLMRISYAVFCLKKKKTK